MNNKSSGCKNILVLAYSISPTRGSEYSVAWNYVMNMAKYHKLTILYGTSGEHMGDSKEMETYSQKNPHPNMEFICVKPNIWVNALNWCNRHGFLCYSFYFAYNAWHRQVYSIARNIIATGEIDLIHLLAPIGYREPGYLWKLDKPYMWGPVGGVSNYPTALIPLMSKGAILKHQFRATLNNFQLKHSRRLKKALASCDVFLSATTETQKCFKDVLGKDSIFLPENGIVSDVSLNKHKFNDMTKIELIFVGSIHGGKNLRLLLEALKQIECKDKVHLNILGDGPEKKVLEIFSSESGLSEMITWHGRKNRDEVFEIFDKSHLHIITSLNEANSTVVLEAMSCGVPTLTLDHCGMHDTICERCGFKIQITSYSQMITDIADVISQCVDHPEILKEKAQETVRCANDFLWSSREKLFLSFYDQAIDNYSSRKKI